ncbi:hypothetical protein BC828DRAFT_170911 [Blastocladiella britannica]|nr:hypothetical protein BC828DRAFT_170911 [Blastocladiella britannica]
MAQCFKCSHCGKALSIGNAISFNGSIFCTKHNPGTSKRSLFAMSMRRPVSVMTGSGSSQSLSSRAGNGGTGSNGPQSPTVGGGNSSSGSIPSIPSSEDMSSPIHEVPGFNFQGRGVAMSMSAADVTTAHRSPPSDHQYQHQHQLPLSSSFSSTSAVLTSSTRAPPVPPPPPPLSARGKSDVPVAHPPSLLSSVPPRSESFQMRGALTSRYNVVSGPFDTSPVPRGFSRTGSGGGDGSPAIHAPVPSQPMQMVHSIGSSSSIPKSSSAGSFFGFGKRRSSIGSGDRLSQGSATTTAAAAGPFTEPAYILVNGSYVPVSPPPMPPPTHGGTPPTPTPTMSGSSSNSRSRRPSASTMIGSFFKFGPPPFVVILHFI